MNNVIKNSYKLNRITYIINPTAGLANTLRGLSSTILLAYLVSSSLKLSNWISINYYFQFPTLLIEKEYSKDNSVFKNVNTTLLSLILSNKSITISDIHGSYYVITQKFKQYITFLKLIEVYSLKDRIELNIKWIIYHEFFKPSKNIQLYLNNFFKYKITNGILGIHIRSGNFKNFKENYSFINNNTLLLFYLKAKSILKFENFSFTYIISDNMENILYLRNKLRKYVINISIPGEIYHSKFGLYNKRINIESIKIVTEFLLLSECDIILGTKRSSFSKEASIYNKRKLILV